MSPSIGSSFPLAMNMNIPKHTISSHGGTIPKALLSKLFFVVPGRSCLVMSELFNITVAQLDTAEENAPKNVTFQTQGRAV